MEICCGTPFLLQVILQKSADFLPIFRVKLVEMLAVEFHFLGKQRLICQLMFPKFGQTIVELSADVLIVS